ncbi:MAG: extracellular catalytic domain type 1 short-chain-length polyhydroxyalkanoate depolymerase [Polyangiaceae bacterium]
MRPSPKSRRWRLALPVAVTVGMLAGPPARAASLQGPIAQYTTASVPSSISMYEYVPDKVASHPPVLVVSHWYGATASAMFGVAQGGGVVAAADKYGFIMVFPQRDSGGCWDISSTQSLKHDGGGDTQAAVEMVKYEASHRGANTNRVYATGQSCGAMFTEALLAVYPDVFKGGSEFSGVPAGGCWTCSNGYVDHTPQQWGAIVDAMDPGYSGVRPRVQLFHGDADMTVSYQNQVEAIKEWTDVLGLGMTPTSTTTLTFGGDSWTRESWQDSCGFTVLDAFTEHGGPHNTTASEDATYVIRFLALDQVGPTDPEAADLCKAEPGSSDSGSSQVVDASSEADASSGDGGPGSPGSTSGTTSGSSGGSTGAGSGSGGSSAANGSSSAGTSSSTMGSGDGSGESNSPSAAGCSCVISSTREPDASAFAVAGWAALLRRRRRRGAPGHCGR